MGNWTIRVRGVGCHHNNNAEIDANLAAQKFVGTLLDQHHTIVDATFDLGSGQPDDLFLAELQARGESPDVIAKLQSDATAIRNTYWPEAGNTAQALSPSDPKAITAKLNEPTAPVSIEVGNAKRFRRDLDVILQEIKSQPPSRERSITITKLQEAIMWLGMDLKRINETPNPYPASYDPTSPKIEPTADGIKL